jgi:Putative peptidoglycan binding domain
MGKQKVGSGETAISLAKKNGFFWQTVWNHGENAELKSKRKDPTLLFEDDEIFIPEKRIKEVTKSNESEHSFKLKGDPCKIKLQLLKNGKPRANEDYIIEIEGDQIKGKTDGEGILVHPIPAAAREGKLILRNGKDVFPLKIGDLDPIDLPSGVQQRLNNLGYKCSVGDESGVSKGALSEQTKSALMKFQSTNKIKVSGELDSATKSKLKELSK